jgi:hypothetical protein
LRVALSQQTAEALAKYLRVTGICCVFPAGAWPWYLAYRVSQLSRVPKAQSGLTAPFNNHGTIVYMTQIESWITDASFFVMAAGFLFLFLSRKIEGKNFLGRWET